MAGDQMAQGYRLEVTHGPARGSVFAVPMGSSQIGRLSEAAIQIPDATVSRRHAGIERDTTGVTVTDLGSANGTYVNGIQLQGARKLRDGDEVRVGSVVLRFSRGGRPARTNPRPPLPPDAARSPTQPSSIGDVHGQVQTGAGKQYSAGRDQYIAGNDQYLDHSVNVQDDYDPWDELFQGRGLGRALMAFGGLLALVGFGLWMYVIFSAMTGIGESLSNPFALELSGMPVAVVGFVAFAVGGILAGIGSGMSKAARKRQERRSRESQWGAGGRGRRNGRW